MSPNVRVRAKTPSRSRVRRYRIVKLVVAVPEEPPLDATADTVYVPDRSLGFREYFTVATPVELVVAVSVEVPPVGFTMVTVTAAPATGIEPLLTRVVIVADRVLPVLTTADAVTLRFARMLADPEADAIIPLVPSVADTLKALDPDAPIGDVNESVVETLAPDESKTDAGLNDEPQPVGTMAENAVWDGRQPAPLLFRTVIVYCNVLPAAPLLVDGESDTDGAADTQGAASRVTRMSAPSRLVESVVILRPSAESVNGCPTSSVESHTVVLGARSIW